MDLQSSYWSKLKAYSRTNSFLVIRYSILFNCHYLSLVTFYWILITPYWLLATFLNDACYFLLVTFYALLFPCYLFLNQCQSKKIVMYKWYMHFCLLHLIICLLLLKIGLPYLISKIIIFQIVKNFISSYQETNNICLLERLTSFAQYENSS